MRGNNVLGVLFSNAENDALRDLTDMRTMGSVPFGSRFRMIDYPLSNMVNSGIDKVAVLTKSNYQSLMDHLGSGKAWDLAKNKNGLFILPPFGNANGEDYKNKLQALNSMISFLEKSKEEYVLLSDCDVVCNIDYRDVIAKHIQNKADITVVYKNAKVPDDIKQLMVLDLDANDRIKEISIDPNSNEEYKFSLDMYLMRRDLLIRLVRECVSKNKQSFKVDLIQSNVNRFRMYGYEFSGYSRVISSLKEYFAASMDLLQKDVSAQLYDTDKPIYTKNRDDMPVMFGEDASVHNSILSHGCVVEGTVKNSVLFRGVHVAKGCTVENCILMQDTDLGANCKLNYIITDKDVVIKEGRKLMGFSSYPVYISKGSVV
ncbi:MAG: glucose-1-phosphate adenylyltransferase subunit GlgD [Clostridia bacterium]|nr:glucose-1-phosphate adenylyltransferase subunit GlgD [Clostridia bacterium]